MRIKTRLLGNNLNCIPKPQKWHVTAKKQQRLHGPAILNETKTKKPSVCRSTIDRRAKVERKINPKTESGLNILVDFTAGKYGIVLLMRKHNVGPNPDINYVSFCIEVTAMEHIETPQSIQDLMDEYEHLNNNCEKYDHDFIRFLKLDKSQAMYICEQTKKESNSSD